VSLAAADLVLEIAAAHILPTIAVEVGRFAFSRATESLPSRSPRVRVKAIPRASRLRLLPSIDSRARIISDMPGRARFEVPGLRGSPRRADLVLQALQEILGVTGARVSTLTGTALITYEPDITSLNQILDASPSFGDSSMPPAPLPTRGARRAALTPIPTGAPHWGYSRTRAVTRKVADAQLPLTGL
jgi:hypothetical protein